MTAARILGVTITAGPLLGAVLLVAVGWVLGHRTARIRVVVVGATAAQDEAALSAHDEQLIGQWRAHLDQLTAPFDTDTTRDETP